MANSAEIIKEALGYPVNKKLRDLHQGFSYSFVSLGNKRVSFSGNITNTTYNELFPDSLIIHINPFSHNGCTIDSFVIKVDRPVGKTPIVTAFVKNNPSMLGRLSVRPHKEIDIDVLVTELTDKFKRALSSIGLDLNF